MGYSRAGFEVVGVDVKPQPHYPFEFHQADALTFPLDGFDAIHASPPCQAFSSLRALNPNKEYPNLIPATRARLVASGLPYVIENVAGAPMGESGFLIMLCGTMFGLATPDGRAEIRRHRLFEMSFSIALRPACQLGALTACVVGTHPHSPAARGRNADRRQALTVTGHSTHGASYTKAQREKRRVICVAGGKAMSGGMMAPQGTLRRRAMTVTGNTPQTNTVRNLERETFTVDEARAAMGIDWMPMKSLSQAIPPAYTEFIGKHLLEALHAQA